MIEKTVLDILKADTVLISLLTKYEGRPAVFSDAAPEKAVQPYLTFYIERDNTQTSIVQTMTIFVEFWDDTKSSVNARAASERIEFLFGFQIFKNIDSRYCSIRTWFNTGGWIDEGDPRKIRYNNIIDVRAARKKWSQQL